MTAPAPRATTTAELAELFTHTARRLRRGSAAQLAPLGITYGQARALRLVAGAGRSLRMAELASQLEVVPRSATTMVDALESAGLVTRSPDTADRRSVLVAPTPSGHRLVRRLERARADSAEEVFGRLGGRQRSDLARLLASLCEAGGCANCCGAHPGNGPGHGHGHGGRP